MFGSGALSVEVDLFLLQEGSASHEYLPVVEGARNACSGNVLEAFWWIYRQAGFSCFADNGLAQGMFGPLLRNRGKLQNVVIGPGPLPSAWLSA